MRGLVLATLTQSRVLVGDLAGAEAAVREAHLLAATDRMPPWWPSLLSAVEAGLTMERGDLDRAVALAQAFQPGPGYNLADCLRGNVLLRGGQAQACLDLVQAVPGERRFAHVAVLIEVLSALALHELGREVDSRDALERALSAATPFALLTPFLMAGPGIAPLLQGHVRAGTAYPELVPRVLARIEGASHSTVNEWGETLTEREHAILRYLATNLSNAEIAEAEFISVNTTKTHIAHVYRKLGVSSRRTALRKAGELGLI
jgi:LuxR family maltose regulon positive regulatory protein